MAERLLEDTNPSRGVQRRSTRKIISSRRSLASLTAVPAPSLFASLGVTSSVRLLDDGLSLLLDLLYEEVRIC